MDTEFTVASIRKALDMVSTNKVSVRPIAPFGLATSLGFEFTSGGKVTCVCLESTGKLTKRLEEEIK